MRRAIDALQRVAPEVLIGPNEATLRSTSGRRLLAAAALGPARGDGATLVARRAAVPCAPLARAPPRSVVSPLRP